MKRRKQTKSKRFTGKNDQTKYSRKKRKLPLTKWKSSRRFRNRMVGGNTPEKYAKLKMLASEILNSASYSSGYIVGSMAIALHEEDQNKEVGYPNDIDIVLPTSNVGKAPDISGMTSTNQTASNGATFKKNDDDGEELSVDVIQISDRRIGNDIVSINGLEVLGIKTLKHLYKDITTGWEYDKDQKGVAENKLERLNALEAAEKVKGETSPVKMPTSTIAKSLDYGFDSDSD